MSGDTTYQALERLSHMPDRNDPQGDRVAGQLYYDVLFTGGNLSNMTITNSTIQLSSPLDGASGGTGVANTGKTITLGGNLTTSGSFPMTLTATASTNVTLPTTGTLATLAGSEALTNKSVNGVTLTAAGSATNFLNAQGNYVTAGGVTSVSGTANRITSTGGATPVIDISASYVGQTSITTLGTVTSGTWSATAIGETKGGTNQTTYAQGDILYASASNTLSKLAKDTGSTRYLSNTGTSNNPAWAQINLANGVTGNLPVSNLNSGTSASSTTFWRGDGTWASPLASTPTRQYLTSGSSATYTTPAGCRRIRVTIIGGGGGGAALATNNGSDGNDSSFNSIVAKGGKGGKAGSDGGLGGTGGTGTADFRIPGGGGGNAQANHGGNSSIGGGAPGYYSATASVAGGTNTGGGGAGGNNGSTVSGGGGGAGETAIVDISSPSATYTYTVGTGGNGGSAGTKAGGNGGSGVIIVEEFY